MKIKEHFKSVGTAESRRLNHRSASLETFANKAGPQVSTADLTNAKESLQ
jgi:hypothetical protein